MSEEALMQLEAIKKTWRPVFNPMYRQSTYSMDWEDDQYDEGESKIERYRRNYGLNAWAEDETVSQEEYDFNYAAFITSN